MILRRTGLIGSMVMAVFASSAAFADEVQVGTKVTQFDPMVVFIKPGDTVKWGPMMGHSVKSVDGMVPEGTAKFESKLGEDVSVKFDKEGAYVYICPPHVSEGMVGVVVVGEKKPYNLDTIKNHPDNKGTIARAVRHLDKAIEEKGMK